MKRTFAVALAAILIFLFPCLTGCQTEIQMVSSAEGSGITFVNEVEKARIWILAKTEENLNATLWGPATIEALEKGGEQRISLDELGGPGTYIVHIFDINGASYFADGIPLDADYSLRFQPTGDFRVAVIEVLDETGKLLDCQSAFEGIWGGDILEEELEE